MVNVTVRLLDATTPAAAVALSVYVSDIAPWATFVMPVTTSVATVVSVVTPALAAPAGAVTFTVSVTPAGMLVLMRAVILAVDWFVVTAHVALAVASRGWLPATAAFTTSDGAPVSDTTLMALTRYVNVTLAVCASTGIDAITTNVIARALTFAIISARGKGAISLCRIRLAGRRLHILVSRITLLSYERAGPTRTPLPVRALLVEDDNAMAVLTQQVLEQEGFAVDVAGTGNEAQTLAMVNDYDAIVLDLGLPDRNGLSVLQALRKEGKTTPVIILTGAKESSSTVRALDTGADDYVTKPIVIDEFRARVRALVRRGGAKRTESLTCGNVTLNRLTREVIVSSKECPLTAKEFQLIEHFMINRGTVISRAELLEKVWDMHFDPGSNVVDVHVTRLRKKLEGAGADIRINAKRGMGFVLVAP